LYGVIPITEKLNDVIVSHQLKSLVPWSCSMISRGASNLNIPSAFFGLAVLGVQHS